MQRRRFTAFVTAVAVAFVLPSTHVEAETSSTTAPVVTVGSSDVVVDWSRIVSRRR